MSGLENEDLAKWAEANLHKLPRGSQADLAATVAKPHGEWTQEERAVMLRARDWLKATTEGEQR